MVVSDPCGSSRSSRATRSRSSSSAGHAGDRDREVDLGDGPALTSRQLGALPGGHRLVARRCSPCCSSSRSSSRSAFIVLPVVAIFVHVPLGPAAARAHEPGRHGRADRQPEDGRRSRRSRSSLLRHADRVLPRVAPVPRAARSLVTLVELPIVLPPAVAGIGLIVAFGRFGLLGSTFDCARDQRRRSTRPRSCSRSSLVAGPVLRPPGDRVVRGGRPEPGRRVAHARRRAAADVLPGHAAARARRARRRRGDLPGARPRRVRRDDHVRRQPPGQDADAAARRLHDVRGAERPRRRARDQRAARDHQPRDPARPQGQRLWERSRPRQPSPSPSGLTAWRPLRELRAPAALVRARARARGRGHGRARRPLGRRQDVGAPRGRGARAAGVGRIALDDDVWFDSATRRLPQAGRAARRARLPGVRALPAHERARRTSPTAARARVDEYLERFRISHLAEGAADRALRRRAPAGRARPRARARPGRAAARRAALGARRAHEGRRPRRAPGAAARVRAADAARHPRLRGRGRRSPTGSA